MEEKLESCPFCDGAAWISESRPIGYRTPLYHVECWECCAKSRAHPSKRIVIEAWNKRVFNIEDNKKLSDKLASFEKESVSIFKKILVNNPRVPDYMQEFYTEKFGKELRKTLQDY